MLRNAKRALFRDHLLRVDFYTPENIRRFFGVQALVERNLQRDIRSDFSVDFPEDQIDPPQSAAVQPSCVTSVGRFERPGEKPFGSVQYHCTYKRIGEPTFDEVVSALGSGWIDYWHQDPPPPLRLHGQPPPPTGPHGNDRILYRSADKRQVMDITFSPSGRLSTLVIEDTAP
jgi:hypothetical protein